MRPKVVVAITLASVVGSAGVGWAAGTRVKSPAQAAADAAPPKPSRISVPVERRELASVVTTRGTVRFGAPQSVTLAASARNAQATPLVTKAPTKGATLQDGSVAMEISGRPVHVLAGAIPMYRDLGPGDQGDDVRQLEEALLRLGFRPGKVDGKYDGATQAAVDAWYTKSGYRALGATDAQKQTLRAAHAAVGQAETAVLESQRVLDALSKGASSAELARAEAEVRSAQRQVDKAREAVAQAKTGEASAAAGEDGAREQARANNAHAESDVRAAENRVQEAQHDSDAAKQTGDNAKIERAQHALEEAKRALSDAQLAQAATQKAGSAAIRQAELASLQAASMTADAIRGVAAATDAVAVAQAGVDTLRKPPDTAAATAALAKANRDLDSARATENALGSEIGIVVPANELLFFPTLPLRVDDAKVARGDDASKAVMVVTTSRLAIDASLSIPDSKIVKVGDTVDVQSTDLGLKTTGTVSRLADKPGTDGVDSQKVYMEVIPSTDAPAQLTGASVALRITVKSTGGPVLAVPVAAVSVRSDGTSRVTVEDKNGTTRDIVVEPGLSAQGFVELRPVRGQLREGDRVVVGKR